jgi:hypothetical protein
MDTFEKIVAVDDAVMAALLDAELAERGIPHLMRSYGDGAMDGLFQQQLGWGHVEAPAAFRAEILEIAREFARRSPEPGASEPQDP